MSVPKKGLATGGVPVIIRYSLIIGLLLASNGFAKRYPDIVFLYGAASKLGWGPTSVNAYLTGILRMGGVAITIFTIDSKSRDYNYKVTYDFSSRNLAEITNKQVESIVRDTLKRSIYDNPDGDYLGYLLVERNDKVRRYDYLLIEDQLEVIRATSLDRLDYQRARLLTTLLEIQDRQPTKTPEDLVRQELGDRRIKDVIKYFFNPSYHEQQVLQTLEQAIDDLNSVIEQKNTVIDNSTDYQSSIALIIEALQVAGLSLHEAIQASETNSYKQLIKVLKAHLDGTIVISEDNSSQLLSTLRDGISKGLRYRIPTSLRLQKEDQVRDLLKRAEQIMPVERITSCFQRVLRDRRSLHGDCTDVEKIQEAKQGIDDVLLSLTGSQLRDTINAINRIRSIDGKLSRQVLGNKLSSMFRKRE